LFFRQEETLKWRPRVKGALRGVTRVLKYFEDPPAEKGFTHSKNRKKKNKETHLKIPYGDEQKGKQSVSSF